MSYEDDGVAIVPLMVKSSIIVWRSTASCTEWVPCSAHAASSVPMLGRNNVGELEGEVILQSGRLPLISSAVNECGHVIVVDADQNVRSKNADAI